MRADLPALLRIVAWGLLLCAVAFTGMRRESIPLHYRVAAAPRPLGAPQPSDVVLRSLRLRSSSQDSPHDTRRATRDFHVTRVEWAYIQDLSFVRELTRAGVLFGAAAAATTYIPRDDKDGWFEDVVIVDRLGRPITAPWKVSWERSLWGDMTNTELERGYMADLERSVDAGAMVLHRDEPGGNYLAVKWGGSYSDSSMAGFNLFLARRTSARQRRVLGIEPLEAFNYRTHLARSHAPVGMEFGRWDGGRLKELFTAFQLEATVDFHERTRAAIDRYAGRRVPFSCNNGARRWTPVERVFDWALGELRSEDARPGFIYQATARARDLGKLQGFTMPKWTEPVDEAVRVSITRQTIAAAYAAGSFCMVPWDVYMPRDAPRYFGSPADYADLYAFVRGMASLLDDYKLATVAGYELGDAARVAGEAVRVVDGPLISAFVQVVPGELDRPTTIHLVDWSPEPSPFSVRIEPALLVGRSGYSVTLLRPQPYDEQLHARAQLESDYGLTVHSQRLLVDADEPELLRIPALHPWGVVVLEPSDAE